MSKITLTGNASGTGVVTLTSPNTNTNRTITLPDATATIATQENFTSTGIDDNATSTAITIDASENVMVGTTSAGGSAGVTLHSSGYIQPRTNTGIPAIYADREGSDGSIVELRKDSTTVGSIGTSFGDFTIGGKSGLRFDSDTSQYVIPYNVTDNTHTTTVDLGTSDRNFKDLYLSGSVYLGGTAAANALDDYETGTWTPTVLSGATSLSSIYAKYTKIGKQVTVVYYVHTFTSLTSSQIKLGGLPYTVAANGYAVNAFGNSTYPGYFRAHSNTTGIWAYRIHQSTGLRADITGSELGTGHILGTLTYLTD